MTYICPKCNKESEKAHYRNMCKKCESSRTRAQFLSRNKANRDLTINPDLSVHALRIKLTARRYDLRNMNKYTGTDQTRIRSFVLNEIAAIETRINELTNQTLWEAA